MENNLKTNQKSTAFSILVKIPQMLKLLHFSLQYIWNYKPLYVIFAIGTSVIMAIQSNITVQMNKYIIDNLTASKYDMAMIFVAIMVSIGLIEELIDIILRYQNQKWSEELTVFKEEKLIEMISKMPLLERENPAFLGNMQVWSLGMSKLEATFQITAQSVKSLFTAAISLFLIIQSDYLFAVIILLFSLFRGMVVYRVIDPLVNFNLEMARKYNISEYFSSLLKRKDAQKEFLLFDATAYFKSKWMRAKKDVLNLTLGAAKVNLVPSITSVILTFFSKLIILFLIIYLTQKGSMTIGDYVSISLAAFLADRSIINYLLDIKGLVENLRYVEEYHKVAVPIPALHVNASKRFELKMSIKVKNLSFYYPNSTTAALKGINFKIKQGEKVAIIGDNAAGKSTLTKILLGLYESPSKTVFYDDVDINDLDKASIWKRCGAIFQDFMKYKMSVRDNITIGNNASNDNDLYSLLRSLKLLDLYHLHQHLDTPLGDFDRNSVELSGGQWQKVALARLLLRDFEILVLDEPTAALDPQSEVEIFNNILSLTKNKTVIIISHRVGISSKVDRIIHMKSGEIKEQGSHKELLHAKGDYYQMWIQQKEWYES
nr:ABC transporter ATP-binding protein [Paenibacillus alba]